MNVNEIKDEGKNNPIADSKDVIGFENVLAA